eukprot:g5012.t1
MLKVLFSVLFSLASGTFARSPIYSAVVLDRYPTNGPIFSFNETSVFENILNPAWIPLTAKKGDDGGLFFRTVASKESPTYNSIGFAKAIPGSKGLKYDRIVTSNLLHDDPFDRHAVTEGADPRAIFRNLTGDFFVTYQKSDAGRRTYISTTKDASNTTSWRRAVKPMFANVVKKDGTPFALQGTLVACDPNDASQRWLLEPALKDIETNFVKLRNEESGKCLSYLSNVDWNNDGALSFTKCSDSSTTIFSYDMSQSSKIQLSIVNGTFAGEGNVCIDVNHGKGPDVNIFTCHQKGKKDYRNQLWDIFSLHDTDGVLFQSVSSSQCLTVKKTIPNDCGTALFFPQDDDILTKLLSTPKAYALATFGEVRGGTLSLLSTTSLDLTAPDVQWKFIHNILEPRANHWDNSTLSSAAAPVRLSDGNWVVFYNVDNSWPLYPKPEPFPKYGRCALGYAILHGKDLSTVLARSEEPLIFAEKKWENQIVYTTGLKEEGNDTFLLFAGANDQVIESFRIQIRKSFAETE